MKGHPGINISRIHGAEDALDMQAQIDHRYAAARGERATQSLGKREREREGGRERERERERGEH
eukprot:692045-Amorphochlora_amoeboformis.AAC.1